MGILTPAFAPQASVSGDTWRRILSSGGSSSSAGITVNEDVAEACSAVFACVRVVSEDVAKLPLILYQRTQDGGKRKATDHPLYWLLHDSPNGWQTSFEWREMAQRNIELRGNAYSFINRVRGEVRELIPLNPDRVSVRQMERWDLEYRLAGENDPRSARDILHVRGMSRDGITGISTLRAARDAIGAAVATQRYASRFFANGARPGLVVKHPGQLSPVAAKRLKDSIDEATGGTKQFGTLVLEEAAEVAPMQMNSDDAQLLEMRQFQVPEIARFFRIPPHKIQDLMRSTNNNIEHQSLEYVQDTLAARLVRFEQRLSRDLLSERERREFFFEFNVDGLLRGDTLSRYSAHQIAFLNGFKSRNEIRVQENLNPVEGGDEFRVPLNTGPAGSTSGQGGTA